MRISDWSADVCSSVLKTQITKGVQVSPEEPLEAGGGPYPLLIAYDTQSADAAYAMTKVMFDLYPSYKDGSPGAEGWALDRQKMVWVAPYPEGAVRSYKEDGGSEEARVGKECVVTGRSA